MKALLIITILLTHCLLFSNAEVFPRFERRPKPFTPIVERIMERRERQRKTLRAPEAVASKTVAPEPIQKTEEPKAKPIERPKRVLIPPRHISAQELLRQREKLAAFTTFTPGPKPEVPPFPELPPQQRKRTTQMPAPDRVKERLLELAKAPSRDTGLQGGLCPPDIPYGRKELEETRVLRYIRGPPLMRPYHVELAAAMRRLEHRRRRAPKRGIQESREEALRRFNELRQRYFQEAANGTGKLGDDMRYRTLDQIRELQRVERSFAAAETTPYSYQSEALREWRVTPAPSYLRKLYSSGIDPMSEYGLNYLLKREKTLYRQPKKHSRADRLSRVAYRESKENLRQDNLDHVLLALEKLLEEELTEAMEEELESDFGDRTLYSGGSKLSPWHPLYRIRSKWTLREVEDKEAEPQSNEENTGTGAVYPEHAKEPSKDQEGAPGHGSFVQTRSHVADGRFARPSVRPRSLFPHAHAQELPQRQQEEHEKAIGTEGSESRDDIGVQAKWNTVLHGNSRSRQKEEEDKVSDRGYHGIGPYAPGYIPSRVVLHEKIKLKKKLAAHKGPPTEAEHIATHISRDYHLGEKHSKVVASDLLHSTEVNEQEEKNGPTKKEEPETHGEQMEMENVENVISDPGFIPLTEGFSTVLQSDSSMPAETTQKAPSSVKKDMEDALSSTKAFIQQLGPDQQQDAFQPIEHLVHSNSSQISSMNDGAESELGIDSNGQESSASSDSKPQSIQSLKDIHKKIIASRFFRAPEATIDVCIPEAGCIRGIRGGTQRHLTSLFIGIPYAAPPTGSRRWKEPLPLPSFTRDGYLSVLSEDEFKGIPAHRVDHTPTGGSPLLATYQPPSCYPAADQAWLENKDEKSEDCLFLNIWAPSGHIELIQKQKERGEPQSLLPVVFYIHGGAFSVGSGVNPSVSPPPGEFVRQLNVVFVSFNYRLGALGFLSSLTLGESAGQFGLRDQQAALHWVHEHISHFGGDPNKITLHGESAGAISICFHLVAPESQGLFEAAILQSHLCAFPFPDMRQSVKVEKRLAKAVGCHVPLGTIDIAHLREDAKKGNATAAQLLRLRSPGRKATRIVGNRIETSKILRMSAPRLSELSRKKHMPRPYDQAFEKEVLTAHIQEYEEYLKSQQKPSFWWTSFCESRDQQRAELAKKEKKVGLERFFQDAFRRVKGYFSDTIYFFLKRTRWLSKKKHVSPLATIKRAWTNVHSMATDTALTVFCKCMRFVEPYLTGGQTYLPRPDDQPISDEDNIESSTKTRPTMDYETWRRMKVGASPEGAAQHTSYNVLSSSSYPTRQLVNPTFLRAFSEFVRALEKSIQASLFHSHSGLCIPGSASPSGTALYAMFSSILTRTGLKQRFREWHRGAAARGGLVHWLLSLVFPLSRIQTSRLEDYGTYWKELQREYEEERRRMEEEVESALEWGLDGDGETGGGGGLGGSIRRGRRRHWLGGRGARDKAVVRPPTYVPNYELPSWSLADRIRDHLELECLRNKPAEELMTALKVKRGFFWGEGTSWWPVVTGMGIVSHHPLRVMEQGLLGSPPPRILMGHTKDEASIFVLFGVPVLLSKSIMFDFLTWALGNRAALSVWDAYVDNIETDITYGKHHFHLLLDMDPVLLGSYNKRTPGIGKNTTFSLHETLVKLLSDMWRCSDFHVADILSRHMEVMTYEFQHTPSFLPPSLRWLKSFHGSELDYVFPKPPPLLRPDMFPSPQLYGPTDATIPPYDEPSTASDNDSAPTYSALNLPPYSSYGMHPSRFNCSSHLLLSIGPEGQLHYIRPPGSAAASSDGNESSNAGAPVSGDAGASTGWWTSRMFVSSPDTPKVLDAMDDPRNFFSPEEFAPENILGSAPRTREQEYQPWAGGSNQPLLPAESMLAGTLLRLWGEFIHEKQLYLRKRKDFPTYWDVTDVRPSAEEEVTLDWLVSAAAEVKQREKERTTEMEQDKQDKQSLLSRFTAANESVLPPIISTLLGIKEGDSHEEGKNVSSDTEDKGQHGRGVPAVMEKMPQSSSTVQTQVSRAPDGPETMEELGRGSGEQKRNGGEIGADVGRGKQMQGYEDEWLGSYAPDGRPTRMWKMVPKGTESEAEVVDEVFMDLDDELPARLEYPEPGVPRKKRFIPRNEAQAQAGNVPLSETSIKSNKAQHTQSEQDTVHTSSESVEKQTQQESVIANAAASLHSGIMRELHSLHLSNWASYNPNTSMCALVTDTNVGFSPHCHHSETCKLWSTLLPDGLLRFSLRDMPEPLLSTVLNAWIPHYVGQWRAYSRAPHFWARIVFGVLFIVILILFRDVILRICKRAFFYALLGPEPRPLPPQIYDTKLFLRLKAWKDQIRQSAKALTPRTISKLAQTYPIFSPSTWTMKSPAIGKQVPSMPTVPEFIQRQQFVRGVGKQVSKPYSTAAQHPLSHTVHVSPVPSTEEIEQKRAETDMKAKVEEEGAENGAISDYLTFPQRQKLTPIRSTPSRVQDAEVLYPSPYIPVLSSIFHRKTKLWSPQTFPEGYAWRGGQWQKLNGQAQGGTAEERDERQRRLLIEEQDVETDASEAEEEALEESVMAKPERREGQGDNMPQEGGERSAELPEEQVGKRRDFAENSDANLVEKEDKRGPSDLHSLKTSPRKHVDRDTSARGVSRSRRQTNIVTGSQATGEAAQEAGMSTSAARVKKVNKDQDLGEKSSYSGTSSRSTGSTDTVPASTTSSFDADITAHKSEQRTSVKNPTIPRKHGHQKKRARRKKK